jgi:hypothetical protein
MVNSLQSANSKAGTALVFDISCGGPQAPYELKETCVAVSWLTRWLAMRDSRSVPCSPTLILAPFKNAPCPRTAVKVSFA